jgi:hypothetical protein
LGHALLSVRECPASSYSEFISDSVPPQFVTIGSRGEHYNPAPDRKNE